jgi:hypothetical protein
MTIEVNRTRPTLSRAIGRLLARKWRQDQDQHRVGIEFDAERFVGGPGDQPADDQQHR